MKILNNLFLRSFIKRGGLHIFYSSILTKIANFFLSIIIVRFISKEQYGLLTYALSIIIFISALKGLGLNHSLLRFGSLLSDDEKKNNLYLYSLKFGLIGSFIIFFIVLALSKLLVINKPNSYLYLILLSIGLISSFPYLLLLSKLRITDNNKQYSKVQILYSLLSLTIIGILTYFFAAIGNVIGILVVPVIVFIIFSKETISKLFQNFNTISFNLKKNKEIYKYAIFVGFGSIASQFTIVSDNIIIGNLIPDTKQIAIYKVGSLIVLNLIFLPTIFLTTDFVHLAKNYLDSKLLKNYYINYLKIFIPISIVLVVFILFFSKYFIPFLFGEEYKASIEIINILAIGLLALFLLRIPLGNMLSAIGKSNWNSYNGFFLVIVNIFLTFFLVKKYGIKGAAYATSLVFWISGLISLGLFIYYLKILKQK